MIGAIKQLWEKVLALIESDERQAAEIEALEARVSQLEAAVGAGTSAGAPGEQEAPASSAPVREEGSTDTATSTTPVSEQEDAGAPEGPSEAPTTPAPEGGSELDGSAEVDSNISGTTPASPAAEVVSPPSTEEESEAADSLDTHTELPAASPS